MATEFTVQKNELCQKANESKKTVKSMEIKTNQSRIKNATDTNKFFASLDQMECNRNP